MKGLTLALEGATYLASVALLEDGRLVAEREVEGESTGTGSAGGKGETLVPLVLECLESQGRRARDITCVICGAGPGSFTSLRIAASVAKGIAFSTGAKMYAVSSLLTSVAGLGVLPAGSYLSVLPAMRGEHFAMRVSVTESGGIASLGPFTIVPDAGIGALAAETRAKVAGPGRQLDGVPRARGVALLMPSILAGEPVDLASWEPDYGRRAEAQARWEAEHRRPLGT